MEFIRIKSIGVFSGILLAEHLYVGNDIEKAKNRFLREYPEHKNQWIVAEKYNSDDEKNKEYFKACQRCECVHYW